MTLTNSYQYIGRSNAVFNYGGSYYYYLLLYAKTEEDTDAGKHKVSVKMRLACSYDVYFNGYSTAGFAKVDGTSAISWSAQPKPNATWSKNLTEGGVTYPRWIDLGEGTATVSIGFGVTKDVVLEASFKRLDMTNPPAFVPKTSPMTISTAVTLPALAGASVPTVSVETVDMDSSVTIYTNRKSDAFTHKLTYSFGEASGDIGEDVAGSCSWTPTLDLASQIPNAASGVATITCNTYNGESLVGSNTVDITLNVPDNESTKPTVAMSLTPVSNLGDAFSGVYVQNLTKVSGEISAEYKYGASLKAAQMVIGGTTYNSPYESGYLTQTGEMTITAKVTDSRDFVGTAEQTITVIPYSKPAIVPAGDRNSIVCARCDEAGNFSDSGTCLRIIAKRSYSTVTVDEEQKNFCIVRYRIGNGSWVTILAGDATENEVDTGALPGVTLALTSAYIVEVGVVDDMGNSASVRKNVPTDNVDINLPMGGGGLALGGYSILPGFTCYWPARFMGSELPLVDYVTETGGNQNWQWRKWNSGKVELWGKLWQKVTETNANGNRYYSAEFSHELPVALSGIAYTQANCEDAWADVGNAHTENNKLYFKITSNAKWTAVDYTICCSFYIWSYWK